MAYILNEQDKELQQQQPFTGSTQGGGLIEGNSSMPSGSALGNKQSGGRFATLQKYLGANQGAGEQLGNQVTQGLRDNIAGAEGAATNVTGNINQLGQDVLNLDPTNPLNQASQAANYGVIDSSQYNQYQNPNSNPFNTTSSNSPLQNIANAYRNAQAGYKPFNTTPTSAGGWGQYLDAVSAHNTNIQNSMNTQLDKLNQHEGLSKYLNANYGGNRDVTKMEGYGDVLSKSDAAREQAGMLGTEEGRFQMIKDIMNPNASRGSGALNQAFLQTSPGGKQIINENVKSAEGIQDRLTGQLNSSMTDRLGKVDTHAKGVRDTTKSGYDKMVGNLQGVIKTANSRATANQKNSNTRDMPGSWTANADNPAAYKARLAALQKLAGR